jgi:hypothetical protein
MDVRGISRLGVCAKPQNQDAGFAGPDRKGLREIESKLEGAIVTDN